MVRRFFRWHRWTGWMPWNYTFWHTLVGKLLAPLLFKPLICGQTCGCVKVTDGGITGWHWTTRWRYWS